MKASGCPIQRVHDIYITEKILLEICGKISDDKALDLKSPLDRAMESAVKTIHQYLEYESGKKEYSLRSGQCKNWRCFQNLMNYGNILIKPFACDEVVINHIRALIPM